MCRGYIVPTNVFDIVEEDIYVHARKDEKPFDPSTAKTKVKNSSSTKNQIISHDY